MRRFLLLVAVAALMAALAAPGVLAHTGLVLSGGNSPDTLVGTPHDDKLRGNNGPDKLNGLEGNDRLGGGRGPDTLNGGSGEDVLRGGKSKDTCIGGPGKDTLIDCEITRQ